MRLVLRQAAIADIQDAYDWYEGQRQGLGEEFLAAVRQVFLRVLEGPLRYPVTHRDVRRVPLRRYPYLLLYRVVGETVVVVGCFHARRNPRRWRSRG